MGRAAVLFSLFVLLHASQAEAEDAPDEQVDLSRVIGRLRVAIVPGIAVNVEHVRVVVGPSTTPAGGISVLASGRF